MDILGVLAKLLKGEKLTEEESKFAESWKPEEGRIPKSRLDEESGKRKAAETERDTLKTQIEELQAKLESLEDSGKSEIEKAQKELRKQLEKAQKSLEAVTAERDQFKGDLDKAQRSGKIAEIARKYRFKDVDYLDYLAGKSELDLADDDAVAKFASELEKSTPAMFESSAKPGGGTVPGGNADTVEAKRARIDALLKENPTMTLSQSLEVARLQNEIASLEKKQ